MRSNGSGGLEMPNSIYISGPMTGKPLFNHHAFRAAETYLNRNHPKLRVESPHNIVIIDDPTWENYMRVALTMMLKCDAIYMLKGWRDSKGARLELTIAQELGMEIIYER
jgi:hypothetical protein